MVAAREFVGLRDVFIDLYLAIIILKVNDFEKKTEMIEYLPFQIAIFYIDWKVFLEI